MEDTTPTSGPKKLSPTTSGRVESTVTTLSERELVRLEFYRTYDVMTGVRIAATLGGFFGLMVLLVVYKSKCKGRSLSDEHLEAAITAVVEEEKLEEDMEVMAALSGINFYGPRRSLGNMSAPPYMRFASVGGGYTSLMHPPTARPGLRGRASLPMSDVRHHLYTMRMSPGNEKDLFSQPPAKIYKEEDEEEDSFCDGGEGGEGGAQFLKVPDQRRRLSSITCSSSDASYLYLERRTSALEMGFPPPRPSISKSDYYPAISQPPWDFYYPIDIQVIQPTPVMSPSGSETNIYNYPEERSKTSLTVPKLAPLASMTSSLLSTEVDAPSMSVSDTVFIDEDAEEVDTEDEVEDELSTDSEVELRGYTQMDKDCLMSNQQNPSMNPFSYEPSSKDILTALKTNVRTCREPATSRRFSAPTNHKAPTTKLSKNPRVAAFSSVGDDDEQYPSYSKTTLGLTQIVVHEEERKTEASGATPRTEVAAEETSSLMSSDADRGLTLPSSSVSESRPNQTLEDSFQSTSKTSITSVHPSSSILRPKKPSFLPILVPSSSSSSTSNSRNHKVPGSAFSKSLDRFKPGSDQAKDRNTDTQTGLNTTGFSISTSQSCDHLVQNVQEIQLGVNKSLPILQAPWSQETLF